MLLKKQVRKIHLQYVFIEKMLCVTVWICTVQTCVAQGLVVLKFSLFVFNETSFGLWIVALGMVS